MPVREAIDVDHVTWGWLHPTEQLRVSSYSLPFPSTLFMHSVN